MAHFVANRCHTRTCSTWFRSGRSPGTSTSKPALPSSSSTASPWARDWVVAEVARPKAPKTLPVVLSQDEMARFLDALQNPKNRFYRANRNLGRIFKTEFLLSYLSEPQLRSRIRRGLLKVEQLHALARDVYYGRRGGSTPGNCTNR